jgi:hypothetical protein
MDAAFRQLGNDTDSIAYGTGKIGSEIAGTLGVGGALGNATRGAQAIPAVGRFVPQGLPAALTTMGMDAQAGNVLSRLALRTGAGAATGAASAALIDPENAAAGGVIGAVLPNALKVAGTAGRAVTGAVKGVNDAFRNPMAVAGRTLQRFGIDPGDVQGLTSAPTATGARTTLAEQIQRPGGAAGAARLQDALRLNPELSPAMEARVVENNAARVAKLRELAGQEGARDFAVANRAGTSGPIYDDAFKVDAGSRLTPELERQMKSLMSSADIKKAAVEARNNAANAGRNVGPSNASGSVEGLHNIKLALDDMIAQARGTTTSAAQDTRARGLEALQKRLVSFIEEISPEYKTARVVHAQMSAPINQMDVAGELLKRGTVATGDLAGTPRLMPDAYLRSLANESQLIKNATGRELGGSLEKVLEPAQLNTVKAVGDELNKLAAVGRVGNGPGSATAGRFASTNLLERMGVPAGLAESPIAQTIMRPVQFAMKMAEPRINQTLLDIIQNPALAREAMKAATPAQQGAIIRGLEAAMAKSPKSAGAALAIIRGSQTAVAQSPKAVGAAIEAINSGE